MKQDLLSALQPKNKGNLLWLPLSPLGNHNMVRPMLPWLVPFHKLVQVLSASIPDLRFQVVISSPVVYNKLLRMLVQLLTQRIKMIKVSVVNNLVFVGDHPATGKKLSRMIIYKPLSDVTESFQLVLVAFHNGRFKLIQYRNHIPQGVIHIKSLPAAGFRENLTLNKSLNDRGIYSPQKNIYVNIKEMS